MLVTITSTAAPATDLGHLLHKHPARHQTFDLSVGRAHVFYPEATEGRCTAALLLDVDPIGLVRNRHLGGDGFSLAQYVNDRPYAASSLLSVAMARVFGTAMSGRCDARPHLAAQPLPLRIDVPVLPCRGGAPVARSLFEPLGWQVEAKPISLDPELPEWGDSRYLTVALTGRLRLAEALRHVYVLLPVLDGAKHYWVTDEEIDKLVRAGTGWLAEHPQRELIARRYLAHQRSMVDAAMQRLADVEEVDDSAVPDDGDVVTASPEPLRKARYCAVIDALREGGARTVVDAGCGEGRLVAALLDQRDFTRVVGVDASVGALAAAARRLRLDRMPERQRERVELFQSSLLYRDERLRGFDALVLVEVLEHLDRSRLGALARNVFGDARPATVLVTTPNADYNSRFGLAPDESRHPDHRFEWTREQFADWSQNVAGTYGYRVELRGIGDDDPQLGAPTQLAVFRRDGGGS